MMPINVFPSCSHRFHFHSYLTLISSARLHTKNCLLNHCYWWWCWWCNHHLSSVRLFLSSSLMMIMFFWPYWFCCCYYYYFLSTSRLGLSMTWSGRCRYIEEGKAFILPHQYAFYRWWQRKNTESILSRTAQATGTSEQRPNLNSSSSFRKRWSSEKIFSQLDVEMHFLFLLWLTNDIFVFFLIDSETSLSNDYALEPMFNVWKNHFHPNYHSLLSHDPVEFFFCYNRHVLSRSNRLRNLIFDSVRWRTSRKLNRSWSIHLVFVW